MTARVTPSWASLADRAPAAICKIALILPEAADYAILSSISKEWRECMPPVRGLDLRHFTPAWLRIGGRIAPENERLEAQPRPRAWAEGGVEPTDLVLLMPDNEPNPYALLARTPERIASRVLAISLQPVLHYRDDDEYLTHPDGPVESLVPDAQTAAELGTRFTSLRVIDVKQHGAGYCGGRSVPSQPQYSLGACLKYLIQNTAPTLRVLSLKAKIRFSVEDQAVEDFFAVLPHLGALEQLDVDLTPFRAFNDEATGPNREAEIGERVALHCPNLKQPARIAQYLPPALPPLRPWSY